MPPADTAGPPRRRRLRWIAVVVSAGLTLGILEGGLAAAGLPRAAAVARPSPADVLGAGVALDTRVFDPDPVLLWRPHRSAEIVVPDEGWFGAHTNARGLRGPELPPPERSPGELRVLCLGDSVTFGLGLQDGETVPALLEADLSRVRPGRPVRVVNGGVPGWSSVQGVRLLDELDGVAPDVVVFWFGMNDAKPALGAPDARARVVGRGEESVRRFLRGLRTFRWIEQAGTSAWDGARRVSVEEFAAAAEHVRADAARRGAKVVFVRGPTRLAEKERQLSAVLARAESVRAERVEGSMAGLSMYVPDDASAELDEGVAAAPEGRTLILRVTQGNRTSVTIQQLRSRRDQVAQWRRDVEARMAVLPAGTVSGDDLLGAMPPAEAMSDNCHLTPAGARRVAESLARHLR